MPAVTATAAVLPEDASPRGMVPRERASLLLLVVSGACFLPGALDRFVFPKLVVAAVGVMLALTLSARGRLPREVLGMLGLGGLLLLAAALTSSAPLAALIGRPPRYEGVIALSVYVGALIAGARLLGAGQTPGASAWLLDVLSVAALAIGLEAALEATGLRPLASNVSRPGSLLGNASDQGAWAVLALGPLTIAAFTFREKLHIAGAVAAAVALATSGSRGALAGAVAVVVVLALCRPRRTVVIGLACGAVVLAAGVLALPASRARVLQTSPLAQETTKGRAMLWSETGSLVFDHPFLGVGPNGYVDAIPAYHDARYEREVGPQNPPDSPHNWILQAASAGGVVLALLAVALAGWTLHAGWRAVRRETGGEAIIAAGLLAGLAGYAVTLLFHFTTPGTAPLAALYAGALLSQPVRGETGRSVTLRRVAAGAYGMLAVVLVAAAFAEIPLRQALVRAAAGDLAAANHDFGLARTLRPWDPGVAQIATHAYAVLAAHGVSQAATLGSPWAGRELDGYPDSVQGLQDAAVIDRALGRRAAAQAELRAAQRLEPENPLLQRADPGPAL